MESTDGLKFLLALEPKWVVAINDLEFLSLPSSDISIDGVTIQFGRYGRRIIDLEWLRPNVVRLQTRARLGSKVDRITLYAGDRLPSGVELRRQRRAFQLQIGKALLTHFGARRIERHTLFADRRHGIGGAYPRFLVGGHAVIAADPDESSPVINGIMRAALLWAPLIGRHVHVVLPKNRRQVISTRLRSMPHLRHRFSWLQWDGETISPMDEAAEDPETHIHEFEMPDVAPEVARICAIAPDLLQSVPHIAGEAVSIRLRGIEVARVSRNQTDYPLGEPLADVIRELDAVRRYGSRNPMARAHEERWLESNLIGEIQQVLPSIDAQHIYPQVPSFTGEERNIIDLLTVTMEGRLVVVEIKASADPDLPFQALDYWIAVERHRKAGDFQAKGYFAGKNLRDEPALLVLAAPLLSYHKTLGRLIQALPRELPLMEIGINQNWKKRIKILRRRGMVS